MSLDMTDLNSPSRKTPTQTEGLQTSRKFELFIDPRWIPYLKAERKAGFIRTIRQLRADRVRKGKP